MYCPECGFHIREGDKYCGRCGALLIVEKQGTGEITGPFVVGDDVAESGAWQGPAIEGPTLAVRAGGPAGATFPLTGDRITIGRETSAVVFLDDITVSRKHAEIHRNGDTLVLRDLGSLNGTYVNRRRIEEPEALEDGDELQIGKFRLIYLAG
jgi:pSer/pThr/pTyr-binding forkhead associated (FHA) protein